MFPTNVCIFDTLSETILPYGLIYFNLAQAPPFHISFCLYVSEGKLCHNSAEQVFPSIVHSLQMTLLSVFLSVFLKVVHNDYLIDYSH